MPVSEGDLFFILRKVIIMSNCQKRKEVVFKVQHIVARYYSRTVHTLRMEDALFMINSHYFVKFFR